VNADDLYQFLSKDATPAIFALFLEYPPFISDGITYPQLGASLRRHPEAAALLLMAKEDKQGQIWPREYARHVFRCAGKPILPILHKALSNADALERSNAARACGSIGDRSSLPYLLQALDLGDIHYAASVVAALGNVSPAGALPRLAAFYARMRVEENRTQPPAYVTCQSVYAHQASGQLPRPKPARDLDARPSLQ